MSDRGRDRMKCACCEPEKCRYMMQQLYQCTRSDRKGNEIRWDIFILRDMDRLYGM